MVQWEETAPHLHLDTLLVPSSFRAVAACGGRGWYTPDQSISVAIRWDNIIHLQKDTSSLALSQNTRGLSSQGTLFDFVGAEITEKIPVSGIFSPTFDQIKCASLVDPASSRLAYGAS